MKLIKKNLNRNTKRENT